MAKPFGITLQGRNVCHNCRVRLERNPAPCPGCGVIRVLAFTDTHGAAMCAGCAGETPTFCCNQCGREDNSYGARCGPCVLRERATELLTDPASGQIHTRLQPVFDVLMLAERPQSAIFWLRRKPGDGPRLLGAMARGEVEISHHSFEQLPANKSLYYLRDFLAALGVLAPYESRIERMIPWLDDLLTTLPPDRAKLIERFARWRVLRHLRHKAAKDEMTKGVIQAARTTIKGAASLLAWLAEHDLAITTATQADLEHYLVKGGPGTANEIYQFIDWAHQAGLTTDLHVATVVSGPSSVTMSDEERWRHVKRLLSDTTIRHYRRIGGLFMLLFAQPLTSICRMKSTQVDVHADGRVFVAFGRTPMEMPEPLDTLIQEHMARRGQASYVSRDSQWLFPGGIPGNHLATDNIRMQLVALGIHPRDSKHAALFQLAATLPHPILADVLGISHTSAIRWAALSSRTWGQYTAARRASDLEEQE